MSCLSRNRNPVVVIEGGVDVTLTPDEMLVATGTVQVATNSEVSNQNPTPLAVTQTTHIITD